MSTAPINDLLYQHIADFSAHIEKYAKTNEERLVMASAMLSVVKAIYLDLAITKEIGESTFERQLEDVFQLNLVKPTIHWGKYEKR